VEGAEMQLVRAQNAQKRAEQAEKKVLLDEMKAKVRARCVVPAYKKSVSQLIVRGIKQ